MEYFVKTIVLLILLTIAASHALASDMIFGCDKTSASGTLTAVVVLHESGTADYAIDLNPVYHVKSVYTKTSIQDGNEFTDGMVFSAADDSQNIMMVAFPGVHSFAQPGLISGGHGAFIQKNGKAVLDEQGMECNVLIK